MKLNITAHLALYFLIIGCCSCVQESPQIKVVCERVCDENIYLFKWEVLPLINGSVKIYSSSDPDHFDFSQTPFEVKISDGLTRLPIKEKNERIFFLMEFNNRFKKVTAARFPCPDKIKNLRDIGGYNNKEGKMTKWAKVFRAGDIDVPKNEKDRHIVNQIKIKTIFDFRDEKEREYPLDTGSFKNTSRITNPIPNPLNSQIIQMILDGKMRKGDVRLYMQGRYLDMYENADIYFGAMFECLLDPENYPVIITSEKGIDRTGFGIALLMMALDIPSETIIEEYLLSRKQIDIPLYMRENKQISPEQQEVISLLLNPQNKVIPMIFSQISHDYGSVDNYLERKLKLDRNKQKKLKELLLY